MVTQMRIYEMFIVTDGVDFLFYWLYLIYLNSF